MRNLILVNGTAYLEPVCKDIKFKTGDEYGKLTISRVLGPKIDSKCRNMYAECICSCGDKNVYATRDLPRGFEASCPKCREPKAKKNKVSTKGLTLKKSEIFLVKIYRQLTGRCNKEGKILNKNWDSFEKFLTSVRSGGIKVLPVQA